MFEWKLVVLERVSGKFSSFFHLWFFSVYIHAAVAIAHSPLRILNSWQSFLRLLLIIIITRLPRFARFPNLRLLTLRLLLYGVTLRSLVYLTRVLVLELAHTLILLTNLFIRALNLGLSLDWVRFLAHWIIIQRGKWPGIVALRFHLLEHFIYLILLIFDSLSLLLPYILDIDLFFLDKIAFDLWEKFALGGNMTPLMAPVALEEKRRIVIWVLVKFKPDLLVDIHGVSVLFVDHLDELSLV